MTNCLSEQQEMLRDLMSEISEDGWAASWMEDLEYVLWYAVLHGPASYGYKFIDEQLIKRLEQLSKETDSWIIFDDDTRETAVVLSVWQKMFQAVDPNRYLKYYRQ